MKKKFIISLSSIILIYLAICLFFVFSYNSKLEKLNPSENCIYTTDLQTYSKTNDIFSIYLTADNISFKRISHTYLSPFEWVKIPKVQFEYNYFFSDPTQSTHYEGDTAFEVFLNEQSLIAKCYTIPSPQERKSGFNPFYFGYSDDTMSLIGIDKFEFYYPSHNGYIFSFYANENPNFNETLYSISN